MSQPKPRRATPVVVLPSGVKMVAPACAVAGCWGVVISFSVDCLSGNGPVSYEQLVQQRLREEGHIVRGGEDAGLAGYAAHAPGGGIVDRAAEEVVEVGIGFGGALVVMGGGRDLWRSAA